MDITELLISSVENKAPDLKVSSSYLSVYLMVYSGEA